MYRSGLFLLGMVLAAILAVDAALARGSGHGGRSHGGQGFKSHGIKSQGFKSHGGFHHRGHFHHKRFHGFGSSVVVTAPFFYGGWPYYWYSPPTLPSYYPAQSYIERADEEVLPAEHWWYYCPTSQKYYPYVHECEGGWQRVAPQPPPS